MNKLWRITILACLLGGYLICAFYLDSVEIRAGNITPIVNLSALFGLVAVSLIAALFFIKTAPSFLNFVTAEAPDTKRHHIYILIVVLTLFRIIAFFLAPDYIQYMRVWPDSTGYLSDMYAVLQEPVRIFNAASPEIQTVLHPAVSILDIKSPIYTIWLIINHLIFGKYIGVQDSNLYFGVTVYSSDIIPPIFFQNIIGIISAIICFNIFSKINTKLAYAVTLLAFLNPTTLAIENAILRESLALFFVLSGLALFFETVQQKKPILGFIAGILFVLAVQTRSELITIYILLCFLLFVYTLFQKQRLWKIVGIFCLPLLISIVVAGYSMTREYATKNYGGRFAVAIVGLKSRCYFYESQAFPELMINIQKRATQCENERKAPCDDPAPSVFVLKSFMDEEIDKYIKNKNLQISVDQIRDQVFIEIVKNNSFCYVKSLLTNVGYNLIHNVHNTTPILYDRDNYWVSQNWNYYVSPKMLVLYEKGKASYKYVVCLVKIIELYATRKILFPFFIIGSVIIVMSSSKSSLLVAGNNSLLIAILLISWIHIVFVSVMANPVARFLYPILPFIFAIEIIGVIGVYRWLKWIFLQQIGGAGQASEAEAVRDIKDQKKVNWNIIIWFAIIIAFAISILVVFKTNILHDNKKLAAAYVTWTMDVYSKGNIKDAKARYDAIPVDTKVVEGKFGKAIYLNGKDSYVKTSLSFQNWKAFTISFWVKPEHQDGKELSVILDNGHDAQNNFAVQSADSSGHNNNGKWVWHCNGSDIFLDIPLNKWTHVVVVADGEKGIIKAFINGFKTAEIKTAKGFVFSATPLTIGKLTKNDARYFKGSIDEVIILDKVIDTPF